MISYRLVSHAKPTFLELPGPIIREIYALLKSAALKERHGGHLVFENEAKNSPRQAFVMMNIDVRNRSEKSESINR